MPFCRLYKHGTGICLVSDEASGHFYSWQKVTQKQTRHMVKGSEREVGGATLLNDQLSRELPEQEITNHQGDGAKPLLRDLLQSSKHLPPGPAYNRELHFNKRFGEDKHPSHITVYQINDFTAFLISLLPF